MGLPQITDLFRVNVGGTQGVAGTGVHYSVSWSEMLTGIAAVHYTEAEIDGAIAALVSSIGTKATIATTLAGYGITNAYTVAQSDSAISAAITALALGSASQSAASSFATSAQGLLANTAFQQASFTKANVDALGINATHLGNQLPAYYLAWDNFSGKPSTFTPSVHTHPISDITALQDALNAKVNTALLGAVNGVATLDASGLVPSVQLPSFVDDVLEAANFAALPVTGETAKIYITLDSGRSYRWSGSVYVEIIASPGTTDNITEGSTKLFYTTARANSAIDARVTKAFVESLAIAVPWASLTSVPGTFTPSAHSHAIADTTGLQTALDGKQASDAGLTSIAGLTTAADRGIYTTASDTYAVYTLTAAGRALLDDANASAQRTTLELGTAALKNTGTSGDAVPLLNAANTFSAFQTFARVASGTTPPASGNNTAQVQARISASNIGAAGAGLDVFINNSTAMAYLQVHDFNDYANKYALNLNPNGGAVQIAGNTVWHAGNTHTHAAADINSGVLSTARLATGTADITTFVRGDGTWAAITTVLAAANNVAFTIAETGGTPRSAVKMNTSNEMELGNANNVMKVLSFRTELTNALVVGTVHQTDGLIRTRRSGNNIEFGHTNTSGYGNALGSEVNSGAGFLAFNAEAGTNNNTYLTRGIRGSVFRSDNDGGFIFGTANTASADNQTLAYHFTVNRLGDAHLGGSSPVNFGATWRCLTLGGGSNNSVIRLQSASATVVADIFTDTSGLYIRTTTNHEMFFRTNDVTRLTLHTTGNASLTGALTQNVSDERLKTNIKNIVDPIEKLMRIGGYTFNWNTELCNQIGYTSEYETEHGVIAQEIQVVMPDAVAPAPVNKQYLTVRYERLVPLLIEAAKKQQEKISMLEAGLNELRQMFMKLKP